MGAAGKSFVNQVSKYYIYVFSIPIGPKGNEVINTDEHIEKEYIRRINKALKFIDEHLDSMLSLETVAGVASYSPYHFHRIFKAVIGEPLNAYITRRRVEKAAIVLMHKKEVSITELSLQYGFNSNSSFTRTFKNYYGVSPSEFQKQHPDKFSKISQVESKNGQVRLTFEKYICNIDNHLNWIKMNAKIEVKETPELKFASITQIGVEGIENAFDRLIKWAVSKGIMEKPETKMARIFYDSFKVTSPDKVRMSICVLTDEPFIEEGEISAETIKKGKCIVGNFEIKPEEFEKSWSSLFVWMNEKGYKKADERPYEIYHNDYREHPEHKFVVDLCIPVE